MANQVNALQNNHIHLRPDVREAILATSDEYILSRQALFKPQLIFATEWVQNNIKESDGDIVRLMGWASLGTSWFAHILGMFIVTDQKFIFVRDDSKAHATKHPIQIFERSSMSDVEVGPASGGWKQVSFIYNGQRHSLERIHKDNATKIVSLLRSKQ